MHLRYNEIIYKMKDEDEELSGPSSPPARHFTIDAYALNTTIIFELLRPWEAANIKPIRKITVTVE